MTVGTALLIVIILFFYFFFMWSFRIFFVFMIIKQIGNAIDKGKTMLSELGGKTNG
jgi:hypothetical protein